MKFVFTKDKKLFEVRKQFANFADHGDYEAGEEDSKLEHNADKKDFDELTIVATAMVMLIAGYDTTAQTLSFCAYELVKNPAIQKRLQEEIDDVMAENDGKLPDYNQIMGMEYLDMVLHETLRRRPPLGLITRGRVKDYVIPGTEVKINAGEDLFVNIAGIHMDPKHYPDPQTFDPERFSKENRAKRHP